MSQVDWLLSALKKSEGDPAYNPQELDLWLGRTPRDHAANLLLCAIHQHPVTFLRRQMHLIAIIGLIAFLYIGFRAGLVLALPVAFVVVLVVQAVSGEIRAKERILRRTALLLARLDDERAIPYLAVYWMYLPDHAYQGELRKQIGEELIRLTTLAQESGVRSPVAESLRQLLIVRFKTSRDNPPEWSELQTDVLLAAVRYIAKNGTDSDRKVLEMVASAAPLTPYRAMVIQAARHALEPPIALPVSYRALLPTEAETITLWEPF